MLVETLRKKWPYIYGPEVAMRSRQLKLDDYFKPFKTYLATMFDPVRHIFPAISIRQY